MKKNLKLRILTCVIGIPAVVGGIFLFQDYNFIFFSIVAIVFAFLGSVEMSKLLFNGKIELLAIIAPTLPLLQYLQGLYNWPEEIMDLLFMIMLLTAFALEIIKGEKDDFRNSIERASKSCLLVIYPSYFITFLIRILSLNGVTAYTIVTFIILVFSNDIFAYIFGMLFGRGNNGILKASPKKSLAGFIGGFLSTIGISIALFAIFENHLPSFSIVKQIILGAAMSISANIGDLIESVFKRSAGVKDSGHVIPGRGGALDSIDSLISGAPIFFIIFSISL